VVVLAFALIGVALSSAGPAQGATLPPGFQQTPAFTGLTEPMSVEFAPNGRVFVAEKSGIIKTYSSPTDTTATVVSDLRTKVHNYWDRGLMTIAVDPNFAANPYIYVYYAHDAAIGGTAPRWGTANTTSDNCPTPPGPTDDGCVVSGRISRIQVAGEVQTGPEQVLIEDWCQQYPSHAGGGLEFGTDGMLYYSGGDGASWTFRDYGQDGNPVNPCGDPPGGVGGAMSPPTAEGGRLRSQDIRSSGDPLGLSGALIRIDPATGAGVPGNPLFSSSNAQERKFIGYGLRNPFRLAVRPGIGDIWVADVGHGTWEEINRVAAPFGGNANMGWPCYEGGLDASGQPTSFRFGEMDSLNLNLCESLYSLGTSAVVPPYWAYGHTQEVVPGDTCSESGGEAISGITFAPANSALPDAYDGALFFGDHSRRCIWSMRTGAGGLPDPATRQAFVQDAGNPVDLEIGSDGNLYYVNLEGGNIQRINFTGNAGNSPPTAVATANPTSSPTVPMTVDFSGTGSTDPNTGTGDVISYAWDLDGDGQLDDSTSPTPTYTYTTAGNYNVKLRVTDTSGAFDEDTLTINAASGTPSATIDTPTAGTTWGVNQTINFTGSATDPEQGTLPGSALDWQLIINHCTVPGDPESCHQHSIQTFDNTASGSFVAPDHDYPSTLELRLTATDASSNSVTVVRMLDPRTVQLTVTSDPTGLTVSSGPNSGAAPIASTVIEGSASTISTPSPQLADNTNYVFSGWSDGQGQTHNATPTTDTTYTARFAPVTPGTSTLTFSPEADAMVDEAGPTTNFGSTSLLRTDAGGNPDVESYLRFLVGGVTAKIQSAKLRLLSTGNSTVDGPAAYPTSSSWTESGIIWNNKPAATGAALSDVAMIDAGQWVEWDVTPAVMGEGPVSFRLAQTVSDGVNFHSRNSATASQRPELVMTVLNDSFPRPKGATPTRISLVPAFDACASPNMTHGPPLASGSCNPPAQASPNVTVGTNDANASPANSSGYVIYSVMPGVPATSEDEADVAFRFSLTDVRNRTGLADYLGELQARGSLRTTDNASEPGTVQDLVVPVNALCTATPDPAVGATCEVATTLDAVTPGLVDEGARAVWELRHIEVTDGGPDGDVDTADNTVFAKQGLFIP
jgi:glucose/arabinose dehydrogenase/PKD repeat protein